MGSDDFIADIKKLSNEEVYNKYVIGGDIWYFKTKFGEHWYTYYDKFKLFISDKLGVHYNDIALAGSAKIGFSIKPVKNFKPFDESSDMDIVIVSQKYFYMFWDAYIRDSYAEIRTPQFRQICFAIFRKYMDLSGFDLNNKVYAGWLKQTQEFEKDLQLQFEIEHEIHYRIFESWDSAKDYYISSINKSRKSIEGEYDENK